MEELATIGKAGQLWELDELHTWNGLGPQLTRIIYRFPAGFPGLYFEVAW